MREQRILELQAAIAADKVTVRAGASLFRQGLHQRLASPKTAAAAFGAGLLFGWYKRRPGLLPAEPIRFKQAAKKAPAFLSRALRFTRTFSMPLMLLSRLG